ncbi:MAG: malate/lactate/ureidoglycolate dehydrogenase [Acidiferrobacteraceae bacterium]|nr:malate/lactate/ureidoglycolate dehydrogenase [Acidiferrobacteraceae bacterium]MBT7181698.1 malate/lactate/ureidoglycolate dehydrogenase [Acidiferrobacteraceae bacterium]
MKIIVTELEGVSKEIFSAIGCDDTEAENISRLLVRANLTGHDSHGVIRIPQYIDSWRQGDVVPNQTATVVFENDTISLYEGNKGFGQTIGNQVIGEGIQKAATSGLAMVGVGNVGHLGRIGDWAEKAAMAGQVSLHFVNTSGAGMMVAPFGGINARYSTNPISIGMPVNSGSPIIFDAATSALAEGKVRVARNKGVKLPADSLLDATGKPTCNPADLYAEPPGTLMPMGGHKGSGLAIMADLLAGAIAGGGCARPGVTALTNGMLSILMDPGVFADQERVDSEISRFADWVSQSAPADPNHPVQLPGDPEQATENDRRKNGIPLDDVTWQQIVSTAKNLDIHL